MLGGQVSVRGEKVVVDVCLILISLVTKCDPIRSECEPPLRCPPPPPRSSPCPEMDKNAVAAVAAIITTRLPRNLIAPPLVPHYSHRSELGELWQSSFQVKLEWKLLSYILGKSKIQG